MWIVRWIIVIIIMVVLLVFAFQNNEILNQQEYIKFFTLMYKTTIVWLMLSSFLLGIIIWLAISLFQTIQLRMELRNSRKEVVQLKEELTNLRNIALEEEGDKEKPASNDL